MGRRDGEVPRAASPGVPAAPGRSDCLAGLSQTAPPTRLRESWLAARNEWGRDAHQAGSGLHRDDDVDSAEGDCYLGAITLRDDLNDFLLRAGGHIGYSVRPSARRRGLATWALRSVLPEARALENAGGILEDVRDTELGRTRRYWITL